MTERVINTDGKVVTAVTPEDLMKLAQSLGAPAPAPAPPQPAPPSGLAAKIIGEWWWCFQGGFSIAQIQSAAPQVNYLSLAGALANGNGPGATSEIVGAGVYQSLAKLQSEIGAWKASGRTIVGVVGGGGDTTTINSQADADAFVAAAVKVIDSLGLQGIDIDLENTPNAAAVASVITQLKAHYGQSFIIALSPRPFELRTGGVYRAVIQAAGIANIDLVQPQDYALAGNSLAQQQSYMDADMADWINNGLIPADKILIGSFDAAEGESLATAIQTYTHYKAQYPGLRGSMFWETREDGSQYSWGWAHQMGQAP